MTKENVLVVYCSEAATLDLSCERQVQSMDYTVHLNHLTEIKNCTEVHAKHLPVEKGQKSSLYAPVSQGLH